MLPFVTLFGRSIPMYGVMTGAGFLLAVLYLQFSGGRRGASGDTELGFVYGVAGAFFGAKLVYFLTVLPELRQALALLAENPAAFLESFVFSGFVFYGGAFGALAAVWLYSRAARTPFGPLAATLTPVVPLIHAFGRLGCFCTGCCYGKPTEQPFLGVVFQNSPVAPNGVPLLPVQLYEAGIELALFAVLAILGRRGKGGLVLPVYLLTYGAARFCLEFLRGDGYRGALGALSTSQILSLAAVALGLALLRRGAGRETC